MKKVAALVTEILLNSEVKPWIDRRCAEAGAEVEWHNVTKSCDNYKQAFKETPNVITWQCRMPHSWTSSFGNNVLHVENSLLNQRTGCFVDSRGFFSKSALCVERHWTRDYAVDCDAFSRKHFKVPAFSGGNPDGPFLLALQCRNDCNINFEFPLAPRCDRVEWTLQEVLKRVPSGVELLIRPHPRERKLFENHPLRSVAKWSMEGDLPDLLPQIKALITVNSTSASEAALLGIPVATLGTGAFTGSGATFECFADLSKLEQFFANPVANRDAQRRYCEAILGAHFLPYRGTEGYSCPEFDRWLQKLA